jgi:hypothetical protein
MVRKRSRVRFPLLAPRPHRSLARVAQLVEHFTRNEEVASSILASGSLHHCPVYTAYMKTLLVILGLVVIFLFGISWRLHSQGWTLFSKETIVSEEKVPETKEASSTPLLFVGDVMLGRYVETLSERAGNELYSFTEVREYLKQHITIANLEGPIPAIHKPTPINGFSFSFPSSTPRILKGGGITAVSLANNHMFDQGKSGWEQTKQSLDGGSVAHFGGYTPTEGDYYETKLGTTTVIVYGITMIATGWDEEQAIEATKKLRSDHPGSYLITFIHWGNEYDTQNTYQRSFAHRLIDAGVDAIIGSHPHVIQGIETYNNKPIFYSLGNFIFDQYWQKDLEDGLMVRLSSDAESYRYDLIPVHSSRSVPSLATTTDKERILSIIMKQSPGDLLSSIKTGTILLPK